MINIITPNVRMCLEIFDHLGHYYSKVYMWQPSVAFNDIIDRDEALD